MGGIAARAASAMRWRATQIAGVEFIYFLRLLVLASLLAPEAFGLVAIASIALSTLMQVSNVGMVPALVQRHDATLEQHDGAWTVGLARCLLVTAALIVCAPWVAELFKEPRATPIIQALALRPSIEALSSIGIAQLTRELRFRELAFVYVPAAIVDLCVALLAAREFGVWALVAGSLAGSLTMTVMSYVFAPHRPRLRFRWEEVSPLADYGRWVLITGILTLAGTMLTQLAVSRMLGATALGLFFLAVKLAYLPIDAANSVVGAVAFPMFAQLREDRAASARAFVTVLTSLHLLLVPVYALTFVLAPDLEIVLGTKWTGTAPIVRFLCIAGIAGIMGTVLRRYLMGHGNAKGAFWLEALHTLALLAALVPCVMQWQVYGAAVSWLVGSLAFLALSIVWLRRLMPGSLHSAGRRLVAAGTVSLAAAAAAWLAAAPFAGIAGIISGGLAGVAAGALVLWWLNTVLSLQLQEIGVLLRSRDD